MSQVPDPVDPADIARLYRQAIACRDSGQTAEAILLLRQCAVWGDAEAQGELGGLLTGLGGAFWAEGVRAFRRAIAGGNALAAWNLAMTARLVGNRRRYLHWMRAAAVLGDPDAGLMIYEIDRRRATGEAWPMYMVLTQNAGDVIGLLTQYREGQVSAAEIADWCGPILRGECALHLEDPDGRLREVLSELVGSAERLTPQRALELIFKLS